MYQELSLEEHPHYFIVLGELVGKKAVEQRMKPWEFALLLWSDRVYQSSAGSLAVQLVSGKIIDFLTDISGDCDFHLYSSALEPLTEPEFWRDLSRVR